MQRLAGSWRSRSQLVVRRWMVANRGVVGEHVVIGPTPSSEFPLYRTLPNTAAASRAALLGNACRWIRALWKAPAAQTHIDVARARSHPAAADFAVTCADVLPPLLPGCRPLNRRNVPPSASAAAAGGPWGEGWRRSGCRRAVRWCTLGLWGHSAPRRRTRGSPDGPTSLGRSG